MYKVTIFGCLWNRSGRYIFIVCHVCKCIDFGEQHLDFSFVSWMDFWKCVKIFFWYFSLAVFLKLALFNPECLALLYHVCIGNLLTENQFRLREMCQYHCLDVLFRCLENKISLVENVSWTAVIHLCKSWYCYTPTNSFKEQVTCEYWPWAGKPYVILLNSPKQKASTLFKIKIWIHLSCNPLFAKCHKR